MIKETKKCNLQNISKLLYRRLLSLTAILSNLITLQKITIFDHLYLWNCLTYVTFYFISIIPNQFSQKSTNFNFQVIWKMARSSLNPNTWQPNLPFKPCVMVWENPSSNPLPSSWQLGESLPAKPYDPSLRPRLTTPLRTLPMAAPDWGWRLAAVWIHPSSLLWSTWNYSIQYSWRQLRKL